MKKRALSFFLMLIMVFALLPTSAYAKYTYDPAKAIAWATNKTEFDKYGGKCAAFVSRCLREGGLKDVSYSEPGAMVSFLEKSDYGTTYRINDANLKKLKAGDVVMVYCGKGHDKSKYWGLHTIFVTAVEQEVHLLRKERVAFLRDKDVRVSEKLCILHQVQPVRKQQQQRGRVRQHEYDQPDAQAEIYAAV